MGYNISTNLTVDGSSTAKNLLTLLATAGYDGPATVQKSVVLYNADAAIECHLHATDSSTNVPGTRQVESTPVAGTITVAGNAVFTVTASGLTGSPVAVNVPVTVSQSNNDKCIAAVTALNSNTAIAEFADVYFIPGSNVLYLKKKTVAANDATLNIAITDPNSTGITTDATSDNTTAGAIATTSGMPFGPASPSRVFELDKGVDMATIWFYTSGSITVRCTVL